MLACLPACLTTMHVLVTVVVGPVHRPLGWECFGFAVPPPLNPWRYGIRVACRDLQDWGHDVWRGLAQDRRRWRAARMGCL